MQPSFKEIIIAAVIAMLAGFGIWYLKNSSATNFVSEWSPTQPTFSKNDNGRTNVLLLVWEGKAIREVI